MALVFRKTSTEMQSGESNAADHDWLGSGMSSLEMYTIPQAHMPVG